MSNFQFPRRANRRTENDRTIASPATTQLLPRQDKRADETSTAPPPEDNTPLQLNSFFDRAPIPINAPACPGRGEKTMSTNDAAATAPDEAVVMRCGHCNQEMIEITRNAYYVFYQCACKRHRGIDWDWKHALVNGVEYELAACPDTY
jgi:hypothetical protein